MEHRAALLLAVYLLGLYRESVAHYVPDYEGGYMGNSSASHQTPDVGK